MNTLFAALVCGVLLLPAVVLWRANRHNSRLPPGPKGDWIIGNLKDMVARHQWRKFSAWSKVFGDIVYLNVLGNPVVILNKFEHARELMDRRGATYSDRPRMVYIVEMVKIRSATFMPYGDLWRLHRRLMQQYLNSRAVVSFRPHQIRSTRNLLEDILQSPNNFWKHVKRFSASSVLSATYGYSVTADEDPLVKLNTHSEEVIVKPGPPGATLVDLFPMLRFLPPFMPGASFKRHAIKGRDALNVMATWPYDLVQEQRAHGGSAVPSLLSRMLDDFEQLGIEDKVRYDSIKDVCGSMYRAGVNTTSATLYVFILAMVLHPNVAKRAQNELDAVLSPGRLPTFEDQNALPYIGCILKECFRWRPPFPLGIAHRAMDDGDLEGKHIPKGSMIMPNIWQMMHDERNYSEPDIFNPDRFVKTSGITSSILDPGAAVFGFGRRICPGRHFAEASLWIATANILAVFDILPTLDEKGCEVLPKGEFTSGLNSLPMEYSCRFIPRNDNVAALIKQL